MNRELYPHQVEAMAMLRKSLSAGSRRPIVQAPTGAGKTILSAAIVEGARRKGNRVLFTVPAIELVDQTIERFYQEGIRDIGVIQAHHEMTDWSQPVQIASVQTLMRRKMPEAHIAIIDECHRMFKFYSDWFAAPEWANRPIIGLSATPWTKGLGKLFDDLIIAATVGELIEKGFLSKFRVFAPSHPDLSKVRTVADDYHEGDLSGVMNTDVLVADVVQTWLKLSERRPTLCFAVDRAHAAHLCESFVSAGVNAAYVDAFTDRAERQRIKAGFERKEIEVVCNVGVLIQGIDWDVRCISLCRPTKSEMTFLQIIGRGLRTADGKDDLLILDHSDTHMRLGFVTDIHHDKLSMGTAAEKEEIKKKNDEKPLPRLCKQCSFLLPPAARVCPSCSAECRPKSEVTTREGELVEFVARNKQKNAGEVSSRDFTMDEKRSFLGELKGYAVEKGYSDGWSSHKFREKLGVWPDHSIAGVSPITPTTTTKNWIKSRQIAFAKSKKRNAA